MLETYPKCDGAPRNRYSWGPNTPCGRKYSVRRRPSKDDLTLSEALLSGKRLLARRLWRITLIIIAIVGIGFSFAANRTVRELRLTHAELRKRVGLLEVEEANKIAITHVTASEDMIPPGVSKAHVWQYRIYIPPNYGPCYQTKQGLVKADSPQGKGGSSTNWSSPQAEPMESLATMALIQTDDKWLLCRTTDSGSSSSVLPSEMQFDSLDDLVIEPIVEQGQTLVFDVDEPICLFRLREKEMAKDRRGNPEKDLYRGFAVYLFSHKHQDAYKAWASGQARSMKEALQ